jgi:hypothetical protein
MLGRFISRAGLVDRCALKIGTLCPGETERRAFSARLYDFMASDPAFGGILSYTEEIITYNSESYIPRLIDPDKKSAFFILGNPTPDSVMRHAMFAYEGNGLRQHRFWKVLHETNVLRFSNDSPDCYTPDEKMIRLFAGKYESPLNIFILPFFSLASAPAGRWAGVAGLKRLFGSGFCKVACAEETTISSLIGRFATAGDTVLVFQRDAYAALCTQDDPTYDINTLLSAPIDASWKHNSRVRLLCLPPTRLLYSVVTRDALNQLSQSSL